MKRMKRIFYNLNHLVAIHRFMEEFWKEHRYGASNRDIVEAGFASSTSVVRYYYDRMEKLGMISIPRIEIDGRKFTPARGIILLPLSKAAPVIRQLLEAERAAELVTTI